MLDLQKVNLSQQTKERCLVFHADLRLHVQQQIDRDSLYRMTNEGEVKKEICKDLLRAMHYRLYGELHEPLAELRSIILYTIPPHQQGDFKRAEELFEKLHTLLKRP